MNGAELAERHRAIITTLSSLTAVDGARDRRGNLVHRFRAPTAFPNGKDMIELTLEFEWFHRADPPEADSMAKALTEADGRPFATLVGADKGEVASLIVRHERRSDAPQATDRYLDGPGRPLLAADATVRYRTDAMPFMTWGNGSTNIELPYARPRPGLGHRIEWNLNTGDLPVVELARRASSLDAAAGPLNPFHWLIEAVPTLDLTALAPQVTIRKIRRKFTFHDAESGEKRFALNIDYVAVEAPDGRSACYADVEMAIESRVDTESFATSADLVEALRARFALEPNDVTRYRRALEAVADSSAHSQQAAR